MTKTKPAKRSPLKVVVAIVAVVVVFLFASAGFRISEYSQSHMADYNARSYIYPAEQGHFGDLYETTVQDMAKQAEYSAEVAECRALAFYYEQAVLEHAYRLAGDDAKADEFAKRMQEYEAQLGSMASKAALVRQQVSG